MQTISVNKYSVSTWDVGAPWPIRLCVPTDPPISDHGLTIEEAELLGRALLLAVEAHKIKEEDFRRRCNAH